MIDKEKEEKIKKLALLSAPLVGAAVVKYAWRKGNLPRGYVYHSRETGNFMIGLYNWAEDRITEIAGKIGPDSTVELEESRLSGINNDDIAGMGEVVDILKNGQESS